MRGQLKGKVGVFPSNFVMDVDTVFEPLTTHNDTENKSEAVGAGRYLRQ